MKRLLVLVIVFACSFPLAAADKKKDPDEIGNRDVGKGLNFTRSKKKSRWASSWRRKSSGRPRSSTIR